jgi:hypothetical protein
MMRSIKTLALAAVAAGALTAFIGAGTASASVLCSTTTDPCTSPWAKQSLDFSIAPGGTATLKEPGAGGEVLDTCSGSTVEGTVTNGTATVTAQALVKKEGQNWLECTKPTATIAGGTLEIHKIAGTSNGTVTGSGFKVTVLVFGFIDCEYQVGEGTDIGSITEGKPAVFTAAAVTVKTKGFGCPEEAEWSATYTMTAPSNTTLSVSAS